MPTNETPPKAQTVPELVRELQNACECFQDGVIFCDERFDDLRLGVKKNNRLLWSICDAFLSQEAEIARLRGENDRLRYGDPNDEPGLDLSKIPQMETKDWL